MRVYKSKYEILKSNWDMITENGFDLSYLKRPLFGKRKPVKKSEYEKLNKIYLEILDSLKDTDFSVFRNYLKWQKALTIFRAELIKQSGKKLMGEKYDFNVKDLEIIFRNYLNSIENNSKEYEVTEYYVIKNFKQRFEELTKKDLFQELNKYVGLKFYDWNQYYIFCQKDKEFMTLTTSEGFKQTFIQKRKITINSLVDLDIKLYDQFEAAGQYDNYQFIRVKLFDLNSVKSKKKNEHSAFTEISQVGTIIGQNINPKKTTLAEWEGHKEHAKAIIKQRNKASKKNGGI